jgi:hypothetical protein
MIATLFILSLLFTNLTLGQSKLYHGLLDTISKKYHLQVISSKPISKIELDEKEMWNYFYFFRDYEKKNLDTAMLLEIIKNSKSIDTTLWSDKELTGVILVNNREDKINVKEFIQKFGLTDKRLIRYFKKQINQINTTAPYDKRILSLSRPVFDNSKRFAVIQWDNAHSGLGGGGGIVLYQIEINGWKEIGTLMNWKY